MARAVRPRDGRGDGHRHAGDRAAQRFGRRSGRRRRDRFRLRRRRPDGGRRGAARRDRLPRLSPRGRGTLQRGRDDRRLRGALHRARGLGAGGAAAAAPPASASRSARRRLERPFALDVAPLRGHPLVDAVAQDHVADDAGSKRLLGPGHGQRPVDGVGLLFDVERVDRHREWADLLEGAGVLGEDQHAVLGVDERSFLGDQVHAVEDRVDHERVVVPVGRQRGREVVLETHVDRHPVGVAVARVDLGHEVHHTLAVGDVLLDVLARGLQAGQKGDPALELGVQLEEAVEGEKAAQDVL